jgi:hypothetical protein
MTTELASILQACQAIDPDAGSLVGEVWNDVVPRDCLPELEARYQREIASLPAIDEDAARQYLGALITRETDELETRLERLEDRAKAEELLTPHRMAFDDSREGRLMRRYETTCKQFFLRCLAEVRVHREERAQWAQQGIGGTYYRPTSMWFHELSKGTPSEIEARIAAKWQAYMRGQNPDTGEGTGDEAVSTKSESVGTKSETRNPKGEGTAEAAVSTKSEIRNPKGEETVDGGASTEPQFRDPQTREDVGGAASYLAEISSQNDAVRCAQRDERAAMERSSVREAGLRLETQGAGQVGEVAGMGAGLATSNMTMSNKERKRRRREERKKLRELSVVSGPLSVV